MTVICCVCHKVKREGGWRMLSLPKGELLSHGYCPACAEDVRRQIARMQSREPIRHTAGRDSAVA